MDSQSKESEASVDAGRRRLGYFPVGGRWPWLLGLALLSTMAAACFGYHECESDQDCGQNMECVSAGGVINSYKVCLYVGGDVDSVDDVDSDDCESHETLCSATCVDTNTSAENCGSCGNECPPNFSCVNGSCRCTTECCSDNDCSGFEQCSSGGQCVCNDSCCTADDCPGNEICTNRRHCVDPATACGDSCDCPPGLSCSQTGSCVVIGTSDRVLCCGDPNCESGQECVNFSGDPGSCS